MAFRRTQPRNEIRSCWGHIACFCRQVDKQVAAALRTAVKRSLGALLAALAGSRKAEVVPLVSLELYLDSTHRIELRPSAQVPRAGLESPSRLAPQIG